MSNNKQSSVKMLWMEIDNLIPYTNEKDSQLFRDLLEKYEAMHKEEKKQVLKDYFAWHKSKGFVSHKKEDIEEFINETFKNDGDSNN